MEHFFNISEINETMRSILVDWLICVCSKFKCTEHTLHLTITLIDKYCIAKPQSVFKKNYQLIGVVCFYIATKIEEVYSPHVKSLVYVCNGAFTAENVLEYEKIILKSLDYNVMQNHLMSVRNSYDNSLVYNSFDDKTTYYLNLILLSCEILYEYDTDDIIESCLELSKQSGQYWSECMSMIKKFENYNKSFLEVKKKFGLRVAGIF